MLKFTGQPLELLRPLAGELRGGPLPSWCGCSIAVAVRLYSATENKVMGNAKVLGEIGKRDTAGEPVSS